MAGGKGETAQDSAGQCRDSARQRKDGIETVQDSAETAQDSTKHSGSAHGRGSIIGRCTGVGMRAGSAQTVHVHTDSEQRGETAKGSVQGMAQTAL
jgi:hypothetical protein